MSSHYLSNRQDVELVFGIENVKRWADADNSNDATVITSRIEWANEYAEQEFLGRILEGPYDPIEVRAVRPKMAIYVCASLGGVYLYDTRRVIDSEKNTERVAKQRRNVNKWIAQIMSGQLKLMDPITYIPLKKTAQNSPAAVISPKDTELGFTI